MYHSNGLYVVKIYVHSKFGRAYPNIQCIVPARACACNLPNKNSVLSPSEVII